MDKELKERIIGYELQNIEVSHILGEFLFNSSVLDEDDILIAYISFTIKSMTVTNLVELYDIIINIISNFCSRSNYANKKSIYEKVDNFFTEKARTLITTYEAHDKFDSLKNEQHDY